MITLEKYDLKFEDSFIEFIKEFQKYGDEFSMMKIFDKTLEMYGFNKKYNELTKEEIRLFFPKYLEFVKNLENLNTIPIKNWVPADTYAICKDGKMIGEISFRKQLNAFLLINSIGHIGYKIKKSERGYGYGTEALKLMLEKVWNMGYTEIMISCRENNISSTKVIEKNGGIFNRLSKPNEDSKILKEYWIFK